MTNQFNWLLYLEVADYLLNQQEEQFSRSATSRAYYGLFCHVKDALERRQGAPFPTYGSIHKQVIDALKNDSSQTVAQLGYDLDRLRRERIQADYQVRRFSLPRGRKSMILARDIESRLPASFS